MRLHIIMHESFEAPAAIEKWAIWKNHELTYTRLYQEDPFPEEHTNMDLLVVMGGPQSPATTDCPHFDAQKEIEFIRKVIQSGKMALGVCLGAQLIGEALGAKFDHSPNREIGVFDLTLTDEGRDDPIFSKFPNTFPVAHWHGDMPGLTSGSKVLAVSRGCPRQVIRYTPKVYGFQCHFEFTKDSVEGMIINCENELNEYKHLPFIQSKEELRKHNYDSINKFLFRFLDYMEESYA